MVVAPKRFQSTRPVRGATRPVRITFRTNGKSHQFREPTPPRSCSSPQLRSTSGQTVATKRPIHSREPPRKSPPASRSRTSHNQRPLRIIRGFRPHVLHSTPPFVPQEVEPQAVDCRTDFRNQLGPQPHPLRRVHQALEPRVLPSLPAVLANTSYPPHPLSAVLRFRTHVIRHQHQHHRFVLPLI